ncbi:TonB-dependent receptor [Hyphomonas sp. WL0036]|uniref:TonB-dependent receptor n=1 Tax=Hyphomonas sediminis TaxID=2866160 RepID=UPI001C802422|nr:TonB-dependent receptor [Hyphomonas sediminis]MBY9068281.1 TonB-dependent receptor [Hyphomonas sediminis]
MKHNFLRSSAAALVASGSFLPMALAQEATELPPIEALEDSFSTSGTGGQDGGYSVSRKDVEAGIAASADPLMLLSRKPGVEVQWNGGIASLPVLRGLADDRVGVLIDGMQVTNYCPNHMNPATSYINAARVERIVVTPTLSPVSLGGDNIAGVIAVESREPEFSAGGVEYSGEAGIRYRSVSNGMGASLQANLIGERFSARYDAGWNKADNYKSGSGDEVRSTLFESYEQSLLLAAQPAEDVLFWVRFSQQGAPYEGFANQRMDLTDNKSSSVQLHGEGPVGPGILVGEASWREVDHEMNFLSDKGGAANGGMPMITEGKDVSAKVSYDMPVEGVGRVRLGAEMFQASMYDYWPAVPGSMMMAPLDYININDGERNRTGVWAEWEAHPAPEWSTLLGLRYERVETDTGDVQPYSYTGMMNMADAMAANAFNAADRAREDDNLDVTAKAIWRPADSTMIEFGAAQKSRSPNLYERYAWGRGNMSTSMTNFTGDGAGYVGDINLKPEVARSLAATIDWSDGKEYGRALKASAWASRVEDYIDADQIGTLMDGLPILQFANHEADLFGIELSGALPVWENDLGTGRLTGLLAWAEGENKETGDNLYNIVPLKGIFALENRKGAWTQALEMELVDDKDRVNGLRQEIRTAGYVLLHLRAGGEVGPFRIEAAIENLLDQDYDLPLGGIAFGDYKYEGRVGPFRQVAGPGRSLNLSVSVGF